MPTYPSRVNKDSTFRPKAARLMDQVSEVMRYHHYGLRTEEAYARWIKGFIYFYNKRHPKDIVTTARTRHRFRQRVSDNTCRKRG